jgi:hypothetical protein
MTPDARVSPLSPAFGEDLTFYMGWGIKLSIALCCKPRSPSPAISAPPTVKTLLFPIASLAAMLRVFLNHKGRHKVLIAMETVQFHS